MSINIRDLLSFLEELNPKNVYHTSHIVAELGKCGLEVTEMIKENGIIVNGHRIEVVQPEWGDPGVYSLHILSTIYEILTGHTPRSQMQGRGFWYREVLEQLKSSCLENKGLTNEIRATVINETVAKRRFNQGLTWVNNASLQEPQQLDSEPLLGVISLMAYLGAYAYPNTNLYEFKQILLQAISSKLPLKDVEALVDKAIDIAELFRRPWEEPMDPIGPTI